MSELDIQAKAEEFLKSIGVPGFIVFGYMKHKDEVKPELSQFEVVSSFHEMPTNMAIKSLTKLLADFADKAL